jgi:DNA-binding NtrC family response regulator
VRSLLLVLGVIQDPKTRALVKLALEDAGHRLIEAGGSAQADALLSNGLNPDLLLCDVSPHSSSDAAEYRQFLPHFPAQNICLITRMGEQGLRIEASRLGIRYFLNKPVTRGDLESVVDSLISSKTQSSDGSAIPSLFAQDLAHVADNPESRLSVRKNAPSAPFPSAPYIEELGDNNYFLAASPKMLEIHRQVKLLADIDVNVLILGESGTGKEVIAQLIHKHSRRSNERFLKVNCAALPTDLLESELFGHRQGAFTGAINDRAGKFEQANRGTLLLDEIGEIGVQMQAKLLHVLQDGQFARLGAQQTTKVDVRVLAATNVQMEDALFEKRFREDLYYRLSVFTIKVPPLRERREEIPYLIEQIFRRTPAGMRNGFGSNIPSRLIDAALLYEWRGNLRELHNFVTRTIVMRDPDAAAQELEAKVAASVATAPQDRSVGLPPPCAGIRSAVRDVKERTEVQMIQNALEVFGWNRRRAAQYLNISYRGLLYKIQQHSLRPRQAGDARQPAQSAAPARQNAV